MDKTADNLPLAYASFTIYQDIEPPEFWTSYFGVKPHTSGRKGERIVTPSGRVSATVRRVGIWGISTKSLFRSDDLAPHLRYLKSYLGLPRADFPAIVHRTNASVRFFCYWNSLEGNRAPVIPEDIHATAEAMGIEIDIDEYR